MAFWKGFRRGSGGEVAEATRALTPAQIPERTGYLYGVPRGGLTETNQGIGTATQSDRRSALQQLHESYLACPWSWASVNAIARTVTAGGIVTDWDADSGEGEEEPAKPPGVIALERLLAFVNPDQDVRQLMRIVVTDLLVFGDAYLEVVWWDTTPVALYSLDVPTTVPETDEHGKVTKYVQVTESGQRAEFRPEEVIHISLDAPRSGVFGVSPTQANLLPITAWLFAAATGKEMFRKGLPPTVHADMPAGASKTEQEMWVAQVMARNVGPRNIGRPWVTRGGAKLTELQAGKVSDVREFLDQKRDEILAGYGVPPAKAGVIESGNLGGGTGTSQDKTFKINTCMPIAELILEKLNFAITRNGFGVEGWHLKFRDVDYRDDQVIEQIRDTRLRNGAWIQNRYRADIGEPPIEGGDEAVLVDRQNLVLWKDMARMSDAMIAAKGAPAIASGMQMQDGPPQDQQQGQGAQQDDQTAESVPPEVMARYRARLAEALRSMPVAESSWDGGQPVMRSVFSQLAKNFPPSALGWIRTASWRGPLRVPVKDIDTADRDHWSASHEPGEVDRFVRKLRARRKEGRELKPAVIVKRPDGKLLIADGHHRFLAYQEDGSDYVWAYVGKVKAQEGPWDQLALSQHQGGSEDGKAA